MLPVHVWLMNSSYLVRLSLPFRVGFLVADCCMLLHVILCAMLLQVISRFRVDRQSFTEVIVVH